MNKWGLFSVLGLIGAHFLTCPCKAMLRIPGDFPKSLIGSSGPTQPISFNRAPMDFSRGFDAGAIQPVESLAAVNSTDVAKFIPQDMQPSSSSGQIAGKIAERGANVFLNSPSMQQSSLGKTAHSVEQSMSTNVAVGGTEPDSIKHSFAFAVKATETKAQLNYSGLTNAQLSYQVGGSTLNLEVREPMRLIATDIVYNHVNSPDDRRDLLSVRWKW